MGLNILYTKNSTRRPIKDSSKDPKGTSEGSLIDPHRTQGSSEEPPLLPSQGRPEGPPKELPKTPKGSPRAPSVPARDFPCRHQRIPQGTPHDAGPFPKGKKANFLATPLRQVV